MRCDKTKASIVASLLRFRTDRSGNVALLFGLMATLLFMAMGGGLDFARAYLARQKLSQVATLACQYASRPAIVDTAASTYSGSNGSATYTESVANFISTTWLTQKVNLTQSNTTPFSYTPGGEANVSLTAAMPTTFIQIIGIKSVPIAAQSHCYDTIASITQRVPDSSGQFIIKESFEAGGVAGTFKQYKPNGQLGTQPRPTTYTSATGYTGAGGTQWQITGYCFEQDSVGVIKSTVPDGNFSGELDCDDGSGSKGNSAISTLAYLSAGSYELRYGYTSRVSYPTYDPAYLCGSAASDLSWANNTNSTDGPVSNALRSNQINVYLDLNPSNKQTPLHTTLDGTQQLGGSNLIDTCVHASGWIERSVAISVTTPGYYWLSFAADGQNESFGGQIDNIRLCRVTCPGNVQDNFPTQWTAGKTLFEDIFEIVAIKATYGLWADVDISTSYGTSGTSQSGWPDPSTLAGWRISQVNQVSNTYYQPIQGLASIELDADGNKAGVANSNRTITRSFLLDPGYYQVSYYYRSNATFSSLGTTVKCGATPSTAGVNTLTGNGTGNTAYSGGGNGTWPLDTNLVGVFMSHDLMASDPNAATYNTVVTYSNPDGTVTSTPKVPNNTLSLTSYNAAQVNPLLDICGYAGSWQTRTATIKIVKPAYYWLTFAALGTSDNVGGAIDDPKLVSLGSLYMSSPPSSPVTIPVPDPQPGSSIAFTGFTVTASPLKP